ncbi:MAG TPA: hypothetical protein VHZ97_02315 [Pseudonocardiaceae bacterium]|jgi:hypothetical protein|nr:hypothetical protein [Pseudonocardiaceae bacterium]
MSSRLGGLLILLGFGSAALFSYTDIRFGFLMWADHAQPGSGIAVGVLGLLMAVLGGGARRRERKAEAAMRYGGGYYPGWWGRRRGRRGGRYGPYGGYGSGPYGDGYGGYGSGPYGDGYGGPDDYDRYR